MATIVFKYNDTGIRTEKNVDGVITKYYLSGNKVTLEDNGTDRIYYTYDSHDDLISMNLNGVDKQRAQILSMSSKSVILKWSFT